jgi:hypothetical protein
MLTRPNFTSTIIHELILNGEGRGAYHGKFTIVGRDGLRASGLLGGITNAGTHQTPPEDGTSFIDYELIKSLDISQQHIAEEKTRQIHKIKLRLQVSHIGKTIVLPDEIRKYARLRFDCSISRRSTFRFNAWCIVKAKNSNNCFNLILLRIDLTQLSFHLWYRLSRADVGQ